MLKLKNPICSIVGKKEIDFGIKVYERIMQEFDSNIPLNENVVFMGLFDVFYRLQQERKPFSDINKRLKFFEIFEEFKKEKNKGTAVTFKQILEKISSITGACEKTFASKIYHTLYIDKPILDSEVAKHFKISSTTAGSSRMGKISNADKNYLEYCSKFDEYRLSDEGREMIKEFNKKYPSAVISDIKKIDFILWQDR